MMAMRLPRGTSLPPLAAALCLAMALAAQAAGPVVTVALSGQPAPDTGVAFQNVGMARISTKPLISAPALNFHGQVTFWGELSGDGVTTRNDAGLWAGAAGGIHLIVRDGDSIATPTGTANWNFPTLTLTGTLVSSPINWNGQIAFSGSALPANRTTGEAVGLASNGSVGLVAREGDQASGVANGVAYSRGFPGFWTFSLPVLSDNGATAFSAALQDRTINQAADSGIWVGNASNVQLLAREVDHAPGTPDGVYFFALGGSPGGNGVAAFDFPVINSAGQVAFAALVAGSGVTSTNNSGIWTGTPGNLSLLARAGDPAPNMPGIKYANILPYSSSGAAAQLRTGINAAGHVAFTSDLTGPGVNASNDSAIWAGPVGNVVLVSREGDTAPGTATGVIFSGIDTKVVINAAGHVAFARQLVGPGTTTSNDTGIWAGGPGTLHLVAREGDQAPGAPSGVSFGHFLNIPTVGGAIKWPFAAVMNAADQVAFYGLLSDGGSGIWATDLLGNLTLIARTGGTLEVAPGDIRTVSQLDFAGFSGNGDGRPSGFNDLGQVAFWAQFTDGSTGIFISNAVASVPEPASVALAASGLVGLLTLARRQRIFRRRAT